MSLFAISCSGDDDNTNDDVNCTEIYVAGLVVNVKDAVTDVELQDGVSIIAVDGNYSERLGFGTMSSSAFMGAYERPGTYILTISKEGYQTQTTNAITVEADECHVIPERVFIDLQPE